MIDNASIHYLSETGIVIDKPFSMMAKKTMIKKDYSDIYDMVMRLFNESVKGYKLLVFDSYSPSDDSISIYFMVSDREGQIVQKMHNKIWSYNNRAMVTDSCRGTMRELMEMMLREGSEEEIEI